ncbi:MAG: extracellular solute-binding protein [Sphaerochaeta sp.]|jgi:spermidine/putrescine transport system substrate-binding protein|nr:extracellular solute-binding protein [Sphaerochaeta sp.]
MKKVVLVLMVLVVVGGMLFAQAASETKNPVLRVITWSGYAPQELLDKFTAETGYKVEVTLSNNEEMISKLRATRGGGFDLAQPSQDRISSVVEQYGIYQPIDYTRLNTDQIDPSLLEAVKKNTLVNGKSYAVPHVYGTEGLVVNKAKAPDIKDFKDLLDPKYAGRVSYRLKRPTLIGMGFSLGYDPFALYSDTAAYQKFLDEMEKVLIAGKPSVKTYWDNGDQLLQSLRSEEVWAASAWEQAGWKLHAENPNIDYIAPTSGALAWVDTFTIPSKSENLDAAYAYINFMLRAENAAFFTNRETYGTASKDAVNYLDEEIKANFTRGLPPEVLANINWYPTVPAGIEEMEGKTLDKIKAAR